MCIYLIIINYYVVLQNMRLTAAHWPTQRRNHCHIRIRNVYIYIHICTFACSHIYSIGHRLHVNESIDENQVQTKRVDKSQVFERIPPWFFYPELKVLWYRQFSVVFCKLLLRIACLCCANTSSCHCLCCAIVFWKCWLEIPAYSGCSNLLRRLLFSLSNPLSKTVENMQF